MITILLIHMAGGSYAVDYPTRAACSDAMKVVMESAIIDNETWAQCLPTYAPTRSLRPVARKG